MLERLLVDREQRGRSPETVHFYTVKGGHLLRLLGEGSPLASLNARAVDTYVAQRHAEGAGQNTIAKELAALRAALKLAKRRGEFPRDVADVMPVAFAPGYKPRRRCLRSAAELVQLLEQLPEDRAAHVLFLVATGARWGESVRAERNDIDLRSQRGPHPGDEDRDRRRYNPRRGVDAPAPRAGAPRLHAPRRAVPPVDERPARPLYRHRYRKAPPVTPNDLRRTFAMWLRAGA